MYDELFNEFVQNDEHLLAKHPEFNNILDCDLSLWIQFNYEVQIRHKITERRVLNDEHPKQEPLLSYDDDRLPIDYESKERLLAENNVQKYIAGGFIHPITYTNV